MSRSAASHVVKQKVTHRRRQEYILLKSVKIHQLLFSKFSSEYQFSMRILFITPNFAIVSSHD
jgi:hypothetical protein